jgi:hypothetical protein
MFESLRSAVWRANRRKDLSFAALLDEQVIIAAFGEASSLWRGWIYTPAVTVWVFLSQCLSADHSCREAVARLVAWRVQHDQPACSLETGAYCSARDALPEAVCGELVRQTGRSVEAEAPAEWLWHGRRVRLVDGSTVTMPDTRENQAEYPQAKSQLPGCGLPIARILVVFSLAVGTVLESVIGHYKGKGTGETAMLRSISHALQPGDLLLGDRAFAGWFDMALLMRQGVELVIRQHAQRHSDFRKGERIERGDHLIRLPKPPCPEWMERKEYDALPDELELREIRVTITQQGFRSKNLLVITTLRDAAEFTAAEIAQLYRRRWQAELNLRSLKQTLQMDHLRCKTPSRVRKEFHMHLVAYNLLRGVMAAAAFSSKLRPWQISFKATLQLLSNFLPGLTDNMPCEDGLEALLTAIATQRVGNRPDRFEPRRVKRRPKPHPLMQKPRNQYKRLAA